MILNVERVSTPTSMSERVYDAIKASLLETDLSQISDTERIDERKLAQRLGVSRTPLRESIQRLAREGFLKVVPRKGIFVVRKSKEEIVEILIVRAALEGMAARLAVKNLTANDIARMKGMFSTFQRAITKDQFLNYSNANINFHELVLRTSQCGKLIEMAGAIFDHIRWVRFRSVALEDRFAQMQKEHLGIITALEKRDADLAEKKMREHIQGLAKYIQERGDF